MRTDIRRAPAHIVRHTNEVAISTTCHDATSIIREMLRVSSKARTSATGKQGSTATKDKQFLEHFSSANERIAARHPAITREAAGSFTSSRLHRLEWTTRHAAPDLAVINSRSRPSP